MTIHCEGGSVAFNDRPIIAESSKQSEESVRAVNQVLSQKNGFISREDLPDLGVDLQVELIEDGQATNNRFVVQIKSSKTLNCVKIDEEELISFTFLTSRLGYLCRHSPGYGLIILYDDSSSIAYYDFVENIVNRLSSRQNPSEWQSQEHVNIHIPTCNVLDHDSSKLIHGIMTARFKNHSLLIAQRGFEYNIPILIPEVEGTSIDFHDPTRVAKLIRDYGISLFNNRDFEFLLGLIQKLTIHEIESSLDVRYIVAIAFVESGKIIDADYHLRKLRAISDGLDKEKAALLRLYSAKVDFRFGRIDAQKYLLEIQSIMPDMKLPANRLSTRINIDFLEVGQSFGNRSRETHERLLLQLRDTIKLVSESDIDQYTKNILLLYAAGNLYQLGINLLITSITRFRILEKTFGPPPIYLRVAEAKQVIGVIDAATSIVQDVWNALEEKERNGRLGAHVHYRLASMFFSFAFNKLMLNNGERDQESTEDLYAQRYSSAIVAYNYFVQELEYDEAYSSLATADEIGELYKYHFGKSIQGPSAQNLQERINQLSKETGREPHHSLVRQYLDETLPEMQKQTANDFANMTDPEIIKFAETYVTTIGLPHDRVKYIISDSLAIKRFKNAVPDKNAELLQDLKHTSSLRTLYASPIIHIARCLHCGFSTKPSTDVDDIIKEYLTTHGQSCTK
jgi:hypothetical protein